MCLHARFRLIKSPWNAAAPRPDYKRTPKEKILEFFRTNPPPLTPDDLDSILNRCLQLIPGLLRHPTHKLPPDLRQQRSSFRHLMRQRWGSNRYITAGKEYRENLCNFINSSIEDTLDSSREPDFFGFTRRSSIAKPVPSLTLNGQVYAGHARIAKCLADHHHASAPIRLHPCNTPDIPPVLPREVSDAINKAPPCSASGPDAKSAELLRHLHTTHPSCLGNIYTDVLRSGIHPDSWKRAVVVPIPKANKATYTHPKSWRSIHLLSVTSKTLERIVLLRLQHDDDSSSDSSPPPQRPPPWAPPNSAPTSPLGPQTPCDPF